MTAAVFDQASGLTGASPWTDWALRANGERSPVRAVQGRALASFDTEETARLAARTLNAQSGPRSPAPPTQVNPFDLGGSDAGTEPLTALGRLDGLQAGTNPLLELVAPLLGPLAIALEPVFGARGLTSASATMDDIFAVEGLLDSLIDTAVDTIGPFAFIEREVSPSGALVNPARHQPVPDEVPENTVPGWQLTTSLPDPSGGRPFGWAAPEVQGAFLKRQTDGTPCYPDIPGWEGYKPKCEVEPDWAQPDTTCLGDQRFLRAQAQLEELKHFGRLSGVQVGRSYRLPLEGAYDGYGVHHREVYRCAGTIVSPSATVQQIFAAYDDGNETIEVGDALMTLPLPAYLAALPFGRDDFRAGVLLHEHVHWLDYRYFNVTDDTVVVWPGFNCLETEYDGAYVQAKYHGASDCSANVVGRAYAREYCTPPLTNRVIASAALGDLDQCFVSKIGTLGVLATLAALVLAPVAVATALLIALPAEVVVMILFAIAL